jgi:hypothetical protein
MTPDRGARGYLDVLDELEVADPVSVLGDDVVADDCEELLAGGGAGAGVGVVVVVDSLRVVESTRVSGDADGATRSRSVTRSVLSVQPASRPTPSARTQKPVKNFFIVGTSLVESNPSGWRVQWGCRRPRIALRLSMSSHP